MVQTHILCLVSVLVFCFWAPARWWHNGETVVGVYVESKDWRGGGYLTWTRKDTDGREFVDVIPVALASDLRIYGSLAR
jgi:hypothetical protein